MSDTLIISNAEFGDTTFDSDVGSWNVTRAIRDCAAGKHHVYEFSVAETLAHNAAIDVDPGKVAAMVADPDRLAKSLPAIFATEAGRIWLIDGHHRLRALAALGKLTFMAFVIEEADAKPYRIFFNGQRVAPWIKDRDRRARASRRGRHPLRKTPWSDA